MEIDIDGANEASDGDSGIGWAQQHDSLASPPALSPVQQAAAADCTFAPSAAAGDGSSVVSDVGPTPYQLPSGSSVRATIWAPAGFKQPTYRSVQFRPPSPGEAATLQQARVQALQLCKNNEDSDSSCRNSSSGDNNIMAVAVVAAAPSPPWCFSSDEMPAGAVLPKSAEDKLPPPARFAPATSCSQSSGATWAASQKTLPVFEEITSATAPISERTRLSYEVRRHASAARGYRDEVAAHDIERLPQDSVASGSRRSSSSSSISAAETCGAEDHHKTANNVGSNPQVMSHHQKAAVPPAVAPKPSKGVRLFIARQHREAEAETASEETERGKGSSTPPPLQPRLPGGSRSPDDEDAANATSDASSTGKCLPLVPPKPRLRPRSSQPTSAADAAIAYSTVEEGTVIGEDVRPMSADVNAGLQHGQHCFSSVESPASAAAAGAPARDSNSCDDHVRNQLQSQQQAPPVLRPRARPPEPPCDVGGAVDSGSSAGGVKRKSLYEIVSTEGRRGSLK